MSSRTAKWRTVAATLAVASLGGCAQYMIQQPNAVAVPPEHALVVFSAPAFDSGLATRVRHVDAWQTEEYARFEGNGAHAEIVYAQSDLPTEVVLDYSFLVRNRAETFNHNRGKTADWGESQAVKTKLATFWFQPYRLPASNRNCFGFSSEWDRYPNDIHNRPRTAMFGYYCAKPGETMSADAMAALVGKVGILGTTVMKSRTPPATGLDLKDTSRANANLAQAKGVGTDAGNPEFPFNFGRPAQESRGSDRDS